MTDVWDAEYNCREKKSGNAGSGPTPPPPPPTLQTLNHMEKIKCNYKSIITEHEFIQFAFFTSAALASSFATDTKAHCDRKIQIHDK